jgi:hypothetical protein
MTPEEALQILEQAAALAPLNRQGHVAVQQAAQVLQRAIKPKPEEKDKK